jgi:hypothetical protein
MWKALRFYILFLDEHQDQSASRAERPSRRIAGLSMKSAPPGKLAARAGLRDFSAH